MIEKGNRGSFLLVSLLLRLSLHAACTVRARSTLRLASLNSLHCALASLGHLQRMNMNAFGVSMSVWVETENMTAWPQAQNLPFRVCLDPFLT